MTKLTAFLKGIAIKMLLYLFAHTAVRTAMPDFYEKMKTRLRTTEEGADTIIWLALSEAALKQQSGLFYQGRYVNSLPHGNFFMLFCRLLIFQNQLFLSGIPSECQTY